MLQSDSHLKPFRLRHELDNVKKLSLHHDGIVCRQKYDIVETEKIIFIVATVKYQSENIGSEDKQ